MTESPGAAAQPHFTLCHTPSSSHQSPLIPVAAVQKGLHSFYCYYKNMINSSEQGFLVPLMFGLSIVTEE